MDIQDLLELLAEKFGCTDRGKEILERIDEDDEADLGDLFELAVLFDDGHGLESVSVETGWHCSKARLFEFGGAGEHCSKHLRYPAASSGVCLVGNAVDLSMAHDNPAEAAKSIADHALRICSGIQTPELLTAAKAAIAQAVAKPADAVLDFQGRAFDLDVGIGSTGDAIDYPLWMHTQLDQDLVELVARHTKLLRQHGLSEVESWVYPLWEGAISMTSDALNVSTSGFWWSAYPKYGNHMVETVRVDFATLASAIAEAVAAGRSALGPSSPIAPDVGTSTPTWNGAHRCLPVRCSSLRPNTSLGLNLPTRCLRVCCEERLRCRLLRSKRGRAYRRHAAGTALR